MSACISSRGEYGSHEIDDTYTCTWCGVLDEDALIAELQQRRAELEVQRQRYAELVRAATAVAAAPDPTRQIGVMGALRAALAELDSPCICSDIDVTSFATPEGVRDVLRDVDPLCPEHGKGTRRIDPLG